MLTTAPQLHIRRPSPTTAEFTVTTRPPLTVPLRFALFGLLLGRLLLIVGALSVLYAKWVLSTLETCPADILLMLGAIGYGGDILASCLGNSSTAAIAATLQSQDQHRTSLFSIPQILLPPTALSIVLPSLHLVSRLSPYLILLTLPALYLATLTLHTTESLLVLGGLGIQTYSSSSSLVCGGHTRFIPTEKIRDVLINEAVRGFEVRYYLVLVVEGEEDMVVVFPRLLPRIRVVEKVWRGVRRCLYEGEGKTCRIEDRSERCERLVGREAEGG